MAHAPAGWYPDPHDPAALRWFDGTQWTAHTAPNAQSPGPRTQALQEGPQHAPVTPGVPAQPEPERPKQPEPERPKKGRRGLWIGLTAGGLAVALAVVAAVVFIPRIGADASPWGDDLAPTITLPATTEVVTDADPQYDFTEPLLDVPRGAVFDTGATFDIGAVQDRRGFGDAGEFEQGLGVTEVFVDAKLSMRAASWVEQFDPSAPIRIRPASTGSPATAFDRASGRQIDIQEPWEQTELPNGAWGMYDEFYIVRYVDEAGEDLAKPVVTRFTVDLGLDAPRASYALAGTRGDVTISWPVVEGATDYHIVRVADTTQTLEGTGTQTFQFFELVASTDGATTWTSPTAEDEHAVDVRDDKPFVRFQNPTLQMFLTSADDIAEFGPGDEPESTNHHLGVIATDGTRYSGLLPIDADTSGIAAAPFSAALPGEWDTPLGSASGIAETFDAQRISELSTRFRYTSIDGATRATTAQLLREGAYEDQIFLSEEWGAPAHDVWRVPMTGIDTKVGRYVNIPRGNVGDLDAEIAAFNAAAVASAPQTGTAENPALTTLDEAAQEHLATQQRASELPEVDYPVNGSTELSRFLAAHLIAGSELVDLSAYIDAPGAPALDDALSEVYRQNPYAMDVEALSYDGAEQVLSVVYGTDRAEAERRQQSLAQSVRDVVGSVVSDGMSDAEKVTALNDWLVANVAYDDAAFAAMAEPDVAERFWYSFTAIGAFEQGTVVCQGYSLAFLALAEEAGLEAVFVSGDIVDGGSHGWNKVLIDGAWRAVDVTWNDTPAGNRYLLIQDGDFTGPAARTEGDDWMVDRFLADYATG